MPTSIRWFVHRNESGVTRFEQRLPRREPAYETLKRVEWRLSEASIMFWRCDRENTACRVVARKEGRTGFRREVAGGGSRAATHATSFMYCTDAGKGHVLFDKQYVVFR